MSEISKKDRGLDVDQIIKNIGKDIAKYDESVNKCDMYATNVLAEAIGSDMDYVLYANMGTTDKQKQVIKMLEKQFLGHVENLRRCTCVKKIK